MPGDRYSLAREANRWTSPADSVRVLGTHGGACEPAGAAAVRCADNEPRQNPANGQVLANCEIGDSEQAAYIAMNEYGSMCIMTITGNTEAPTFSASWHDWHAERERYYGDPLGWVSITGLHWLTDEFDTVADLPGQWRADARAAYVEGFDGVDRLEPVEGAPGLYVESGERRIEVIRRTGSVGLRIHDPQSPHLHRYHGIPAYEPSESWLLTGRFTALDRPTTVTTGAVVAGLEHHHTAVGTIEFDRNGATYELTAFGRTDGALHVLFTDATSGVTTYPGARSLSIDQPTTDGTVVLDFNRASNLPCSFTDYATCPVAPPENGLAIAVEAGEKNPR